MPHIYHVFQALRRNECRSSPCQHGGTCEDAYGTFLCRCPAQWAGARCDVDVNECGELAGTHLGCQNGASCVNLEGSYRSVPPLVTRSVN